MYELGYVSFVHLIQLSDSTLAMQLYWLVMASVCVPN